MNFKAGDVVIFDSDGSWWDVGINLVSKSTHTAMFTSSVKYIEAGKNGIEEINFVPKKFKIRVYRAPKKYGVLIPEVVNMARFHIGDKYSIPQAVFAGLLNILGWKKTAYKMDRNWYCNEFTGYLMRYGYKMKFGHGAALDSLVPDDIEHAVIADGWELVK